MRNGQLGMQHEVDEFEVVHGILVEHFHYRHSQENREPLAYH